MALVVVVAVQLVQSLKTVSVPSVLDSEIPYLHNRYLHLSERLSFALTPLSSQLANLWEACLRSGSPSCSRRRAKSGRFRKRPPTRHPIPRSDTFKSQPKNSVLLGYCDNWYCDTHCLLWQFLSTIQPAEIGWPAGNGMKLSNSQACCLAQLCLAAA